MPLYVQDRNGNVQAAADQIVWAGDTNLYRSAADTLKTDDSLVVGAVLTVLGAAAFNGAVTGLTKATVGLSNVDNTADTAKPVSTAQAAANALRVLKAGDTMTGALQAAGVVSQNTLAGTSAVTVRVAGEAFARYIQNTNGSQYFGSGAADLDTNITRTAPGTLSTGALIVSNLSVGSALTTTLTSTAVTAFSAIAAANGIGLAITITGESAARFFIGQDGKHYWGSGAAAQDTLLYRSAAGTLRTDGILHVNGIMRASTATGLLEIGDGSANTVQSTLNLKAGPGANSQIQWTSAGTGMWLDYVIAGSSLRYMRDLVNAKMHVTYSAGAGAGNGSTDFNCNVIVRGGLTLAGAVAGTLAAPTTPAMYWSVTGDTQNRFVFAADGKMSWGPGGATVADTNLYRNAADTLKTDDSLIVVGDIKLGANAISLHQSATSQFALAPASHFHIDNGLLGVGTAPTSAGMMAVKPNGVGAHALLINAFAGQTANLVQIYTSAGTPLAAITADGKLVFGPGVTGDTNLYRTAAGVLKTDGVFRPGAFTTALRPTAAAAGVGGEIYDTTLSRPIWSDGTAWRFADGTAA